MFCKVCGKERNENSTICDFCKNNSNQLEETKNMLYIDWVSNLLNYNKDVIIKRKSAVQNIVQRFNAHQSELDNTKNEINKYINACQTEISEMLKNVNNLYISNGLKINTYNADTISNSNDIVKLRKDIETSMQTIRNSGSALLLKTPTKMSVGIGIFLLLFYIIPGIIYFVYVNQKIETEKELYEDFCINISNTYSIINNYKKVAEDNIKSRIQIIQKQRDLDMQSILSQINQQGESILSKLHAYSETTGYFGLDWINEKWHSWTPSSTIIPELIRIGDFINNDTNYQIKFPVFIPFQQGKGLFYKTSSEHYQSAISSAKSLMLRLLLTTQPGKLFFTLIDPVQLGGSINEFLSLTDVDPELINKQVCSSTEQISNRLAIITEQIKTIQQVYLKTDFNSIEAYNNSIKTISEPYHIIFINDFPINFSNDSIRNLISISINGPKCGIYPIIIAQAPYQHYDVKLFSDIENSCLLLNMVDHRIYMDDPRFDLYTLSLDESPSFNKFNHFKDDLLKVAEVSLLNKKVEYSYTDMLSRAELDRNKWWQGNTGECLEAPIGPSGAKKILHLQIGKSMQHGVLCVGRPGSGKSNLMSVIITSLALKYSPDELQLYLIDLKNGITFKQFVRYNLPHAKVIAIDSDREFSLAVLKGLENEMEQRGIDFRISDIRSISEFRIKTGKSLPRILLIIDEFQDLFTDMDSINKESTKILERLIREGQQLGIHVFLGTQSLAGISIPKAIIDLIAIRIALQCGDAESRIVLSEDNSAAKLLKKPGEAIYNDGGGIPDSNVKFQVAYYNVEDEKYLCEVRDEYKQRINSYNTVVFDGSVPSKMSDLSIIRNYIAGIKFIHTSLMVWIGKPVNTQEYVSIEFKKRPGDHLSIVTSNRKEGVGVMLSTLLSLSIYDINIKPVIYYLSYEDDDSEQNKFIPSLIELYGTNFRQIKRRGLSAIMETLCAVIEKDDVSNRPQTFLYIDAIHKSRDFDSDYYDSENMSMINNLQKIIRYGSDSGIHVVVRSESFERFAGVFGRNISEFNYRIAGSMDIDNSMQYIADLHASRIVKSNRMIMHKADGGKDKYLNFIPYIIPDIDLVDKFINISKK